MPTAKKIYTFNETIVTTGAAVATGETDEEFNASLEAIIADESNYITVVYNGVTSYLLPLYGTRDGDLLFMVYAATTKPLDPNNSEGFKIIHSAINGGVLYNMAGLVCEITDMGGMSEWVLANAVSLGMVIPMESQNGVKLLLNGKVGEDDVLVIPQLFDKTGVTPMKSAQKYSAPEGYAGFSSFTVDKIPDDYIIPEGEQTFTENGTHDVSNIKTAVVNVPIPEGYVKPEGEVIVTENVEGMDISDKATLTVAMEGGAKYNIAYGDTAPEDTTKFWIKTAEPAAVEVKLNAEVTGNDGLVAGISSLPSSGTFKAAAVGTKVYLFGNTSAYVFDTETKETTTLSITLPSPAGYAAVEAVGSKIYFFGGYNSTDGYLDTICVFDTKAEEITTLTTKLLVAARYIASAVIGSKIYLFGGGISGTSAAYQYSNEIWAFDTQTESIYNLSATLPYKTYGAAAAAVDSKVYIFGGEYYLSASSKGYSPYIYEFDLIANTATTVKNLPSKTRGISAATFGKKIYLFGGSTAADSSGYLDTINVFDTETKDITTLSTKMPTAVYNTAAATIGTKVYLFGGSAYSGGYITRSSIDLFTILIDLPENHVMIEASSVENRFNLLPNMEMGVKNVYLGNADGKGERVAAALYKNGWVEI